MPRIDLAPRHLAILGALLRRHAPGAEVWAFGSRVSGAGHAGSDLDLALRNPANLAAESPGLPDLRDALEASALPMLVDLHDWASIPEGFRKEIARSYVVLQGAGESAESGADSRDMGRRDA